MPYLRPLLPLLLCLSVAGCHLIFRYEDRGPDGGSAVEDLPPPGVEAGAKPGDGGKKDKTPAFLDAGACPKPIEPGWFNDFQGDFYMLYNQQTAAPGPVQVDKSISDVQVRSLDHHNEAAGFVMSMPAMTSTHSGLLDHAVQRISYGAIKLGGNARLITSGVMLTSHDGHPLVAGLRVEIKTGATQYPSAVRNAVAAGMLLKDQSMLTGWMKQTYTHGDKKSFVVAMAALLRSKQNRVIFTGSVAATERVTLRTAGAGVALDDVSNGTNLAAYAASPQSDCTTLALKDARPQADIIWVMDESGSMGDDRAKVANQITGLFKTINRYQLDVRMGITSMIAPNKPNTSQGKFCSATSGDPTGAGGQDRFLGSHEQGMITACLKNPPYSGYLDEWGLSGAYQGVVSHLPRTNTTAKASKIRGGATVAVIIVSDEYPEEISKGKKTYGVEGFLESTSTGATSCSMSSANKTKLATFIKPWTALFGGTDSTWGNAARARVYLLARHCALICSGTTVPVGYQEISRASGGQQAGLCVSNMGLTLGGFIEDTAGAASPLKLGRKAISASLKVRYGTTWLNRSRSKGFDYRSATNSVVLVDKTHLTKTRVTATYKYWK